MKDPFDRTKVVLRHLPPAISQSALFEQIDNRFAGRYKWFSFRPGKICQKNQRHARAYIDFNKPEDVVEFAEFFDGHVFVNEKGAQFKTIVEYAPSQRVPKPPKKDGREGTLFKDPEYLEFLDHLAKPAENLPSAEVQLERKEAEERAGGQKETLIVTPLMEFVRQKRAAKIGSQRPSANGKLSRRGGGVSSGNSSPASTKRASEKRRTPPMYVMRDSMKNASGKEKSTYLLVPRRGDDQQLLEKPNSAGGATGTEIPEDETVVAADQVTSLGSSGTIEIGKKRLLLKGKEKEISVTSGGVSQQHGLTPPLRNSQPSAAYKQSQRRDVSGRIIRSILSSKDSHQGQSPSAMVQSEQQILTINSEKDKRPPRPTNVRSLKNHIYSPSKGVHDGDTKRASDDKVLVNEVHNVVPVSEKQDRRTRNKDRPDRGVWTPLRRSDNLHGADESLSMSSQQLQITPDSSDSIPISQQAASGMNKIGDDVMDETDSGGKSRSMEGGHSSRLGRGAGILSMNEFTPGEMKLDMPNAIKSGEFKVMGRGRENVTSIENGSHRHSGRRGSAHGLKEADSSPNFSEGKPSKRGGGAGYGSHEKQVWVQKSGSGS